MMRLPVGASLGLESAPAESAPEQCCARARDADETRGDGDDSKRGRELPWRPEGSRGVGGEHGEAHGQERAAPWGDGPAVPFRARPRLRRWTASSVGEGFSSVWHRDPAGRWTFYESVTDVVCGRYFGAETERVRVGGSTGASDRLLHPSTEPLRDGARLRHPDPVHRRRQPLAQLKWPPGHGLK